MAARTTDEVRHDLEAERERLESAVDALRLQAAKVRRTLPFVAVGVVAVGVLAGLAKRRFRGRD